MDLAERPAGGRLFPMSIAQAGAQLGHPVAHLKPAAGTTAPIVVSMTSSNGQVQAILVRHEGAGIASVVQVNTTRTDLPAARLDTTLASILASLLIEASNELDPLEPADNHQLARQLRTGPTEPAILAIDGQPVPAQLLRHGNLNCAGCQLDSVIIAQTWTGLSTPPELTMTN
jgi:hypothetical protein